MASRFGKGVGLIAVAVIGAVALATVPVVEATKLKSARRLLDEFESDPRCPRMSKSAVEGVMAVRRSEPVGESDLVALEPVGREDGTIDLEGVAASGDRRALFTGGDATTAEAYATKTMNEWRSDLRAEAYPGYTEANTLVRAAAGYGGCF